MPVENQWLDTQKHPQRSSNTLAAPKSEEYRVEVSQECRQADQRQDGRFLGKQAGKDDR